MTRKPTYEELEKRIRELEQTESGRKQVEMEEALHERQQLLEIVINELPFWFSLKDKKGRYVLVNQKMAEAHGVTVSDFINHTTLNTPELHPGGLMKMLERDNQVLKTGERIEVPEYSIMTSEGLRLRRLVKIPWKRNTGEIIGVISWSEDITVRKRAEEELVKYFDHLEELVDQRTAELQQGISERKRAEEALRENEARLAEFNQLLAGVLEHTHMMAVFLDPRFNFIWVNRAYADTCRHEPSFFQGKNHFYLYPHQENQAIFQRVVDTGDPHFVAAKPFEFPDQPERGVTYWDWSLIPVKDGTGTVTGLVFTLAEVTERRQAEQSLQEAKAELKHTVEVVPGIIAKANAHTGYFTNCNPALSNILGFSLEEFLERPFIEFIHPDDRQSTINEVEKQLKGSPVAKFENRYICKDGAYKWLEWSATAADEKGVVYSSATDITVRKQTEEALRESEGRYRNIFENIQDVYYEASMDGTILEISPSVENVSEYKRKELIGKSLYDIYTNPEERDELVKAVLVSGKVDNFEAHLTDKNGSQHSVELNVTLQRDQKGKPIKIIGSIRDISKRKRLEARLRQSQKMESIGTLAGGIAHEFNNILGTIIGNTELAINDVPESNPARECLEEIQSASLRAKNVVRQILGFARKSVFQLVPVQISPIIIETLKLIRASIPTTIEIRQNLSCKSDTVMADPTQINQVLISMCTNAKNAMQEKGGVLEVKLEDATLDKKSATRYEDLSPGNYVKLTVKDSGHGIDPKNIDRIFDPYFTTTSLAEGTGMGLAVVHGIVKHHNGAISVESEPGKGTVFEVLFPLTEAEAEQEAGESEGLPTGTERILFIDDEESLVKLGQKMLNQLGYSVETKRNPIEALELVRSEPDRFDLVITDMTMPQMTGDKLAKEILSIRPDMPIILCTGFSEKIDDKKAQALGIRKYIEKPFVPSDFAIAIRKVLDAGRSEA